MSVYFTKIYVFFMLLILAVLFFMFNKKKQKKTESFSARQPVGDSQDHTNNNSHPNIDTKNDVYYKKNNNIANIESRCFSKETEKYIWKKRWNKLDNQELTDLWHNKFKDRNYKNFSTPEGGKLMLENNAEKCRKKCKKSERCQGYSIRYRENEAIRCLLHYGQKGDITQICGRDNMICLQKLKKRSYDDYNIKCNNKRNKLDEEDEEDDQDIHISTFNKLPIYRDLFDKLVSDKSVAAFKDKFIHSYNQPINEDIHDVNQCGYRCMSHFMNNPDACFGFIFNSMEKKCTILERKPTMK
jgi:hypothetical protein